MGQNVLLNYTIFGIVHIVLKSVGQSLISLQSISKIISVNPIKACGGEEV